MGPNSLVEGLGNAYNVTFFAISVGFLKSFVCCPASQKGYVNELNFSLAKIFNRIKMFLAKSQTANEGAPNPLVSQES